jgi:SAM-dependent methyltransferase
MIFCCNICGVENPLDLASLHRELVVCRNCGSNARFRGIFHAIQTYVAGRADLKADAERLKRIKGLGFSDAFQYAGRLAESFDYTNTYYHQSPRIDIMERSTFPKEPCDFIVCSDVLEHVVGDLDVAFKNLRSALKPGGKLIFSVPYLEGEATIEHFPYLDTWKICEVKGKFFLNNVRADGTQETFTDLNFHGGPGAVLEMRIFGEGDLIGRFKKAGFASIKILEADVMAIGYVWPYVVHRDDHQGRRMKGCVLVCS